MSTAPVSYRSTVNACYTANFIGALVINLTPVMFIPLKMLYNLSYTQFGILLAANYVTQVAADVVFSWPVDRFGYRPFAVLAPVLTVAGYLIFCLSPLFLINPFPGFVIGTIVFSATGGLLELLLSAIVNGIPGEQKATLMSVLHSFYAWGQLTVVLLTTAALWFFGTANWQWIIAAWGILPAINVWQFATCSMPPQVPAEERQGAAFLLRQKTFYIIIAMIAFGGMAEVSMPLWTSAFLERAINLPKITGDTLGMCLGAAMLGTGRLLYGLFGEKRDVWNFMLAGAIAGIGCYMLAALAGIPFLALAGCVLCCLATSLLWPGSVVLAGKSFPLAGAWLYAMLAAGGDLGASAGPYLLGVIADHAASWNWLSAVFKFSGLTAEQFGLRCGILCGSIFPLVTVFILLLFRREQRKNQSAE
ncbi:MAG: MFS transporter [Lentisphaeria bacterium]|nr:MFS transporter [Lentisphaeria bacterium]